MKIKRKMLVGHLFHVTNPFRYQLDATPLRNVTLAIQPGADTLARGEIAPRRKLWPSDKLNKMSGESRFVDKF